MLNADRTDTLTKTLDDLTDKNLFAYCDNNPIMRDDYDDEFWQYAFAGAGTIVYAKSKGKTQRPDQKRRGHEGGEKKNNRDWNKGKKPKYRTEKN